MSLISFVPRVVLVYWFVLASAAPAPAQQADPATARRIADVVSIALAEYEAGVVDGRVVLEEELDEARLFLTDALEQAASLPEGVRGSVVEQLGLLLARVEALRPARELAADVGELRRALERIDGVVLDPMPTGPPSIAAGAKVYQRYCQQCHGATGDGDGAAAVGLDPPPARLRGRSDLGGVPLVEFFRKINVGVAGTAMPGFSGTLDLDDRWAVALYAASLRNTRAQRELGAKIINRNCVGCELLVSDFAATAHLSDDSLAILLAQHIGLSPDHETVKAAVAYGRIAGSQEELGGDHRLAVLRTVRQVEEIVAEAALLAGAGDYEGAGRRALDAYLVFERIETTVRAQEPALARRVERAFGEFRGAVMGRMPPQQLSRASSGVTTALAAVVERIETKQSATVLFGQALVVILREGLEAILIIGALAAVLTKAGVPERRREIALGVGAALGASVVTAIGFATLFRSAVVSQEVLEGVTMLVAAAVLFWVSYWLLSKVESRRWAVFVRSQVDQALASRRAWALAGVAFLAVYREGFETVLFYAALFAASDGTAAAVTGIAGGFTVGALALAAVFVVMQRYGVRLPLKPFFAATSALLYLMAFSIAGQGVAELQDAGLVPITPLEWLPSIPVLGIIPTVQTVVSQLLLALALVGGLVWVFVLAPRVQRAVSG
jgi:high-affinity iron transporter